MLPDWTAHGLLPPGVHRAQFRDVAEVLGWNPRRRSLLLGLKAALDDLAVAGCDAVYLDGSFVTRKDQPGDYDGAWDPTNVDPLLLNQVFLDFSATGRATRSSRYQGDLFIAGRTEASSGLAFVDFFQRDRNGDAKGIVLLNPLEER